MRRHSFFLYRVSPPTAGTCIDVRPSALFVLATFMILTSACGGAQTTSTSSATSPTTAAASDQTPGAPHAIRYSRVVDLTHAIHDDMAFWPGGVPFHKTKLADYDQGYLLYKFEMGENTGTHVDAPAHFIEGKTSIDTIPPDKLVAPAVVIDIQAETATDPDYQLTPADITAWEAEHGPIPAGTLVILNTGWHRRFDDMARYVNMDESQVMRFPGYGQESVELLVERDVAGIGIDTLSIDHGPSPDFPSHRVMLKAGKYQVENLANLDALPPTGATVIVAVLPVRGGSQAQARVLAFVP